MLQTRQYSNTLNINRDCVTGSPMINPLNNYDMTLTEALETLAKVLPVEVVELIRGHFLALDTDRKINLIYNESFPNWGKKGEVNDLFKADKLNDDFINIEDHLWSRACNALNNWLYNAYCEEYIKDHDDEE